MHPDHHCRPPTEGAGADDVADVAHSEGVQAGVAEQRRQEEHHQRDERHKGRVTPQVVVEFVV